MPDVGFVLVVFLVCLVLFNGLLWQLTCCFVLVLIVVLIYLYCFVGVVYCVMALLFAGFDCGLLLLT